MLMRTKKNNIQKTLFAVCLALFWASAARSETGIGNQQVKETSAYHSKGLEYFNAKQYEAAVEMWQKEIEGNPKSAWAHYNIGLAYEQMKNYEEAFSWKKKAIDIDPKNGRFYWGAGVNLGQMGKYKEALEYFEKALTSGYQTAETYGWIAYSYYNLDSTPQGLTKVKENLTKALFINPDYDFGRGLLKAITSEREFEETMAKVNTERGDGLEKVFQENLPGLPFYFKYSKEIIFTLLVLALLLFLYFKPWYSYYLYAGDRHFKAQQHEKAATYYEKLFAIRNGRHIPYDNLKSVYLKLGRMDEKAIHVYEKIYKNNPENKNIIQTLANAYARKIEADRKI